MNTIHALRRGRRKKHLRPAAGMGASRPGAGSAADGMDAPEHGGAFCRRGGISAPEGRTRAAVRGPVVAGQRPLWRWRRWDDVQAAQWYQKRRTSSTPWHNTCWAAVMRRAAAYFKDIKAGRDTIWQGSRPGLPTGAASFGPVSCGGTGGREKPSGSSHLL